jgi:hypothetical protein
MLALLAEAEREILTQAITLAEGNQAKAARWLGCLGSLARETQAAWLASSLHRSWLRGAELRRQRPGWRG